ncbi:Alkaline protease 1 [Metarhizium anisopliae]|nr:Alkaline protease 1 [Metarhizium anisopliae]
MAILKAFTTAVIAALSLSVAAAPQQDNNGQKDKYIITLKSGISSRDVESHVNWARGIHETSLGRRALDLPGIEKRFDVADFHAYSGAFDIETLRKIKDNPDVLAIERDAEMVPMAMTAQQNSPWSLGAISSRTPGSKTYRYDDSAGENTFAYVIDSGVKPDHVEFGGRASIGHNNIGGDGDQRGHGTLVAGLIASNTYGVAKKANIIAAKTDFGTSSVLDAMTWAVQDIQKQNRVGRAVINFSAGLTKYLDSAPGVTVPPGIALAQLMETAFKQGILCVIASGNSGVVVEQSEAPYQGRSANALVVGAVDEKWNHATFSNHGASIDILAAGDKVMSLGVDSNTATRVESGTSLATAHVTGLALYLIAAEKIKTAAELRARILALATKDKVTNIPANTVNLLAFNGAQ